MDQGRLMNSIKDLNRKDTLKPGALQSFKALTEALHGLAAKL